MHKREPFYNNAKIIIDFCACGTIDGYVAAHSITDCFYILRKLPVEERRTRILGILDFVKVIGIDINKLLAALNDNGFDDIEDCLQAACAADLGLDYIVTRNVKDFGGSKILAITPKEFLAKLENE